MKNFERVAHDSKILTGAAELGSWLTLAKARISNSFCAHFVGQIPHAFKVCTFYLVARKKTANMSDANALPPTPELSAADKAKTLGNEAFTRKEYEKAIGHYEEAIRLEASNPIFYSNISACHAALKNWPAALEQAIICVSKDDKFVKGYLRLAAAQTELKQYDDAERTLRAALTLEPGT